VSIGDFKAVIRDKAYMDWFKRSTKSIFIQTATDLRPSEQTKQKTSFLITEKDIADIGAKLAGRALKKNELLKIRNDLVASVARSEIVVRKDNSLFFPVIDFEKGISNVLKKGFDSVPKVSVVDKQTGDEREARISDFYQKGHVFSIATNVAEQTKTNLMASNAAQQTKELLLPVLEGLIAKLRQEDLDSSNIKSLDFDLYASYSKNPYKYIVEMQPEEVNRASGVASAPVTNALRRYFDPRNYVEIDKYFRKRATEDGFIQKLITSKGSPSYIKILEEHIEKVIRTGKEPNIKYSVPRMKVHSGSRKVDTTKYRAANKAAQAKIKKLADGIKQAAALATASAKNVETENLTSLLSVLNGGLVEQVKKNMGNGSRADILNLRSGRFAESAKVERLSESRAGMITVFYSYMKNPYATFSAGGRQETPRSRDPKLLIAKSIREIASKQVANRLRSVAV